MTDRLTVMEYEIKLNFIAIKTDNLCLIQHLELKNKDKFYKLLSKTCLKHIDMFFSFVNILSEYELVNI